MIHDFLQHFEMVFTKPSFQHFSRLVMGFTQTTGPKAVTEVNDSAHWSRHFSTIYDFLRKAKWSYEKLSKLLTLWILSEVKVGEERVLLCLDDTKNFKPHASKMEKICWHADHHKRYRATIKSSDGEELAAFAMAGEKGHCWVTLGLLHQAKMGWSCFPVSASIFLREKHTDNFKTKHRLALEMIEKLPCTTGALLVGDNFYGTQHFVNALPCAVLSLLKSTAVAYRQIPKPMDKTYRGRPKRYGEKVELVKELSDSKRLKATVVNAYGKKQRVQYGHFKGLLKGHKKPVQIILVQGLRKVNFLLFTNDLSLTPEQMIEYYSARYQIELTFRELKQELGAFNYRLRSETSILRYVHIAFVAFALLKYLSVSGKVSPIQTPWYKPKGRASPRQVQGWIRNQIEKACIFLGVEVLNNPSKNITTLDFTALQGA